MESVVGDWHVEVNGKERHFRVSYANTFDEPVGGLMNVLLTEDGHHYQHAGLNEGRALVIDIGGFTTDWLAVCLALSVACQPLLPSFQELFGPLVVQTLGYPLPTTEFRYRALPSQAL